MKILFVNSYPLHVHWGVETVMRNLMASLREKGASCDLVCLSDRQLMLIEAARFREKFMINMLILPKLLARASHYDIIHFNAYNSFLAKFVKHKPTMVTLHGSSFGLHERVGRSMSVHRHAYSSGVIERMERIGSRVCDRVVAVSDSVRKQAKRGYGIPDSHLRVVHNGVALSRKHESKKELRKELGLHPSAPLLITVTRGDYTKGTDMLLKICKKMHKKHDARLLVVGHIPKHLHRDWMTFATPRHHEIWKYYQASDVYLNTSRYEGFGLAMLEAMGYGIPAVSFNVGIAPEAIKNGRNGFVCNLYDLPRYEGNLSKLIRSAKLRKKLGRAAAKTVRSRFTASKMADGYLKLYRSLLNKRR